MSISFFSFSWAVTSNLTYLQDYPEQPLSQVRTLINEQCLDDVLAERYPGTRDYAADKTPRQYTQDLKGRFLCNAPPINKAMHDNKTHVLKNVPRLHTAVSHVQGGELEAEVETRVATASHNVSEPFLHMIVVHELAHLKEEEHNRAFYQLCCHMGL